MPSWRKSQQGVGNGLTNDFPLQPAFVPFIEQTARYLGGSERHGGARPVDAYLDVNMTQWLTAGATRRSSVRFGAEPVRCDLDTVIAADVQGAEIVIHCAAFVAPSSSSGTSGGLGSHQRPGHPAYARRCPTGRRLAASFTSVEAALVRGQHLRGVDETAPLAFDSPYPYCRTKALAELAVRAAYAPRAGVSTV